MSILFLAGAFGDFLLKPSMAGLLLIPLAGIFAYHFTSRMIKAFGSPSYARVSREISFYAIPVIFIVTVFLLFLMTTLPSVGVASSLAGIDLGVIVFLWGYAINLYHRVVYSR